MSVARILNAAISVPKRIADRLYVARLHDYCTAAPGADLTPSCTIINPNGAAAIKIGKGSLIMCEIMLMSPGATVEIGEFCFIGPGTRLWVASSLKIGDNTQISHGVFVSDNNSHSLSAAERHAEFKEVRATGRRDTAKSIPTSPVVIEDDAWVGFNSAILKGVRLGKGAVVGACSMITTDVEAYSIVVGNPPRKVGESRA